MKFAVNDRVVIHRDNKFWNGSIGTVVEVSPGEECPYRLLMETETAHRPNTVGTLSRWSEGKLKPAPKAALTEMARKLDAYGAYVASTHELQAILSELSPLVSVNVKEGEDLHGDLRVEISLAFSLRRSEVR